MSETSMAMIGLVCIAGLSFQFSLWLYYRLIWLPRQRRLEMFDPPIIHAEEGVEQMDRVFAVTPHVTEEPVEVSHNRGSIKNFDTSQQSYREPVGPDEEDEFDVRRRL